MLNICAGRRDLVIALAGRMVSTFGDGVALVALTLRLQADGEQPYAVDLLLAAGAVPMLLLARPVGRLVDRHDSRRLLVAGSVVEAAAAVPLIFVRSLAPILLLVAVLGGAASLISATWSSLLPRIVGEGDLARAVSAQQALNLLAYVAAPAVGGLLAGAFGSGLPVSIDAATFVVLAIAAVLVRIRRVPDRPAPADQPKQVQPGGLAVIRGDRLLAELLAGVALVVVLVGMVDVVLVYLVRATLHAGGVWYGVAEASWMAGMVGGALGAGRVRTDLAQQRATIAGAGLVCAAVACIAIAPDVWLLVPLSILGGVGNGYAGTCLSTLLTTRTPDSARGRVSATANAVLGTAQGASLLFGGLVATVLSPRAIYALAGLLGLAAAATLAATTAARAPNHADLVDAAKAAAVGH